MGEAKLDLKKILDDFDSAKSFWRDAYERGELDVKFALGNQWPDDIRRDREKDGRPCLTENRMLPFVNQVINQIRQARPSIIPKPVDDEADERVAEIARGLIRNIETVSDADTAYDTAARNSVMGSIGWIRVTTDYADCDTFDQEIRIERIQNPFSAFLDPNHQRQDGSDAQFAFIETDMALEEFKEKYPDAAAEGFGRKDWSSDKTIKIVECFYREEEEKELVEYEIKTLAGVVRQSDYRENVPVGSVEIRTRKTDVYKIKYFKVSELDILEEGEFAGQYIPLVPVYGLEACVNGKRTFYSLIHQAKDPQLRLNYTLSADTEGFALQPKAPFIGAEGMFDANPEQWRTANRVNYPFLTYRPVNDDLGNPLPPPQRQMPPSPNPVFIQAAASSADAIKATLGMFDASLGNQTPDISGKAIISRQMQGDNATFHFVDNLSVAIRHVGRIIIGLIPLVYTGSRIIRIMGEDGKEALVPLNRSVVKEGNIYRPAQQGENNAQVISFDAGKYDIVVEVGASYATRRQETLNLVMQALQGNPDLWASIGDLFFQNADVPGAEDMAKRIRATMNPALLGEDLEAQRLQQMTDALNQLQQKLQLTEEALLAKKQNEEFKNSLEAKKVENDTKKLMIEAAKAEAEIEKIRAETGQMPQEALGMLSSAISQLKAQTDDVSSALHVLLSAKEGEGTGDLTPPAQQGDNYVGQPDIGSSA